MNYIEAMELALESGNEGDWQSARNYITTAIEAAKNVGPVATMFVDTDIRYGNTVVDFSTEEKALSLLNGVYSLFTGAQPAQPVIPEGMKLVPIEPTQEMWAAVNKLDDEMAAGGYDGKGCSIEQAWNCLLAAAPAQPVPADMMLVAKEDANNYCRILTRLGMEEEGDPVSAIEALLNQSTRLAPDHVVAKLIAVAHAAFRAADDSEEVEGLDGRQHVIGAQDFDALSDALDALEELPDDKPGCTLNGPAKAEWALRNSTTAQPVPAVTDGMAYAFHNAIGDGPLGADEVEEIKTGLRAAIAAREGGMR